jgi:hypothetical protein
MVKKSYEKPVLIVHGGIETITKKKVWGIGDQWIIIEHKPSSPPLASGS